METSHGRKVWVRGMRMAFKGAVIWLWGGVCVWKAVRNGWNAIKSCLILLSGMVEG